jgi:hypothetical protein
MNALLESPDLLCCPTCRGGGRVALEDLHPDLALTLDHLRRVGASTVAELAQALDPRGRLNVTAFNNRLERLRAYGLVERIERDGKAWVYQAVEARH